MLRVTISMKTVRNLVWVLVLFLSLGVVSANARTLTDFDGGWRFSRGDFAAAMMTAFDDGGWQTVTLPHDWSSDGPFSAEYGSGNGFAPGGIGWYRKHFQLDPKQAGMVVTLEFDGVYDYSEVWVNGQFVGGRPYGYSSFQCEITPFVRFGGDNIVAVRVDHSRFADSRYYTGSGIYRNVRLVVTGKLHVAHWGVYVTTPKVSASSATVHIETTVEHDAEINREFELVTEIVTPDGQIVATARKTSRVAGLQRFESENGAPAFAPLPRGEPGRVLMQDISVRKPELWNLEEPKLYHAVSKVLSSGVAVDEVTNAFGIREFHFDPNKGFFLNGKNLKLKGVCLHHDAGPIGAAVPDAVLERRLRAMKELGANAIRTSHNPPDPGLLDMCDRMGFLVMDEAFDEFTPGKNKWVTGRNEGTASHSGYNELFAQWSVTDIQDLVRRDRNHPSIILWSIGNEIDYANDPFSHPVLGHDYRPGNPRAEALVACAKPLIAAVTSLDPTRPVTAALATVSMSDAVGLAPLLDADGYNYQESRYAEDHQKYPHRIIYGSENSQLFGAWEAVRTNDFIAGQFLWTGADYLGEANRWPNRASGPGLLDLCDFKKPLGWFRQSLWSDQPMVYLCASSGFGGRRGLGGRESWNWRAGSTVTVLCYANCPIVELRLNGKVVGTQKTSGAVRGVLRWEIPYEPGTLEAVGLAGGLEACRYTLHTAEAPARIELLPDQPGLHADGKDVCEVEFRIVDAHGVRVPDADPQVNFEVTGPGRVLGIGNGDVDSTESCKSNQHHAYQGRGLVILQSTAETGDIGIKATAPGLDAASVIVLSR